jgi:predicted Zn-dependent protease
VVSDKLKHVAGEIGVARALMELGRADEASDRLVAARWRHPLAAELVMAQAHLALRRGNIVDEMRYWELLRERFPLDPRGYREGAQRLRAAGREDDAEAVLRTAIQRYPQETWPTIDYAAIAHNRKDWPAAITRWQALRIAWPDHPDGYLRGAEALDALGRNKKATELRAEYSRRSAA